MHGIKPGVPLNKSDTNGRQGVSIVTAVDLADPFAGVSSKKPTSAMGL